ncbi:homoserine O-acetyltransferase, putative [Cryptococcus deneoformans JEC21]|uniref:Homoserine O-acetyltransferase, putative n=2 Tax=Cryptococcus deneoformans TaxID=40410 RepID=Q5K8P2_CRYD1|nr:homoserine O-acetyltransferase, putative [Cryptococcus neoformans var. neoformans JEC21]AAW46520.2 homoserine O-acetyltransferase, putative [Cryptococcus neoformans var. neoformans JEC21]
MSDNAPTPQKIRDTNPYASLISQQIAIIPSFTLESGVTLNNVPVAYKTWGKLNEKADNCLVICHALTGSADVEDWWGPLLGLNKAFDPTRFFIFCGNVIGSPYGTISSVTTNPETGKPFGPEMPGSSVKDDVRLHYIILKSLGVKSVAAVVGGSMGGMTVLEYPLNTPPGFVRAIIPLATSARHSAWCISWGEAQRQSIYSDPDYKDGYYYEIEEEGGKVDLARQPARGLAAARMAALLTYRSRDSFESRFGRRAGGGKSSVPKGGVRIMGGQETTDPSVPSESDLAAKSPSWRAWREHNDGHRSSGARPISRSGSEGPNRGEGDAAQAEVVKTQEVKANGNKIGTGGEAPPKIFSAQSYLRYQGDKFTGRFDANCYIHITRKLDTHDLSAPSRDTSLSSLSSGLPSSADATEEELNARLIHALSLEPPALVIGIESDGLFTTSEQRELAAGIPDAELVVIPSPDGHDGFLLEFEAINGWVEGWLKRKMPEFYEKRVIDPEDYVQGEEGFDIKKESVFGEAEADVTRW